MGLRNSIIHLAKNIKLDKDYRSVLNYNENDMLSLITNNNNAVYSANDYSFIRDTGTIKLQASLSQVCQANYMAFQNKDYNNKWYFAFIDEVIYKGDNCTEIRYTVDIWTTWFSYWNAQACFVVREHVTDDTLGKHTIPENLETGEYIVNAHLSDSYNNQLKIVMGATVTPGEMLSRYAGIYHGVPSGITYYSPADGAELQQWLNSYASNGKIDAVNSLFLAPSWLVGNAAIIPNTTTPATFDLGISRISSLDTYTPVNKKLLTYPYCYILLTNGAGASATYYQEVWGLNNQNEMVLRVYGVLTPGCSIRAYPLNYNGDGVGIDYGLTLGKFPQLNWATDQFTSWMSQNGVNVAISTANSLISVATGVATGNPIGVASGSISIASTLGSIYQHSLQPPQLEGNINAGDVNTSIGANRYHAYRMTIKREFASLIDKYFTKVGYKVNTVKVPNMSHRQNYNFVQIGAEDNVAIANNNNNVCPPASDLNEINNLFRRGITIWNNHTNLGDYSVSNNITN